MRRALGVLVTTLALMVTTMATGATGATGATAASAANSGAADAPSDPGLSDPGLQKALDDVVATGAVGALAEVHDGRRVWRGTSGVAQLGTTHPVLGRSHFRAGSITKTFIATVVLQLAGEGRLRLGDPVETWLPGEVPGGTGITIRELLAQTSGLPDVVPTLPMPPSAKFYANRWRTWSADELIQRALAQPTTAQGTFHYASTNYLLLGQVIEAVTGRPYAAEIERRILRPLGLHHTRMPGTSPRLPRPHLHGYVPGPDGTLLDYTRMNPSVFGAAGDLVSTAPDLDRFFRALLGGRLLPPRLLAQMTTPAAEASPYGLGVFVRDTTCGVQVIGHDGDALAYQSWSYATADLRRRVTIALTPSFAADTDETVDAFLDRAFCGKVR